MSTLTDIEKRALSRIHYGEGLRPVRDWLVLLAVAGVLFLASVLANIWLYEGVQEENVSNGNATSAPSLDTATITAVQKLFETRAAEEAKYRAIYHFVDPSK